MVTKLLGSIRILKSFENVLKPTKEWAQMRKMVHFFLKKLQIN